MPTADEWPIPGLVRTGRAVMLLTGCDPNETLEQAAADDPVITEAIIQGLDILRVDEIDGQLHWTRYENHGERR